MSKISKKPRFYSELVKIEGFMFGGESLYKIWDGKLKQWRLGAYTIEKVAKPYVDKLNFQDKFGLI